MGVVVVVVVSRIGVVVGVVVVERIVRRWFVRRRKIRRLRPVLSMY